LLRVKVPLYSERSNDLMLFFYYLFKRKIKGRLLQGWKPLNLEWYDGTIDLDEHLDAFLTQANLYTNDDAILCRIFLTFLKGALTWYSGLPPRPIDIFHTLVERFNLQHATSCSHCMTSAILATMQQADDKSLRKFMNHFGHIVV